ncbi:MAG TPA: BMC domain-containing protein [Planctomycetota bacterium]|nr:BMC domain-containing protein [Planctomycetota bacterium]HQB00340.1 BMC domain-containing protein [Planctomycetota bacterium]
MKYDCVGLLELSSIAKGIFTADALLKKASVSIIFSHPISSGKYLIFFEGEVEEVTSALETAKEVAGKSLVDFLWIPQLHAQIRSVLQQKVAVSSLEAVGVFETATCASSIVSVDAALKEDKVQLLELRLGKGIGGKAFWIIQGTVENVDSALLAAQRSIPRSYIVEQILIPNATPDLLSVFQE